MTNLNKVYILIILIISISDGSADSLFRLSNNALDDKIKYYEQSRKQYKYANIKDKQKLLNEVRERAKNLFNIPNSKLLKEITSSINNCCKYIETNLSKTKNIAKYSNTQLNNIYRFLKTGIKLLNEFTKQPNIIDYLILLCPEMIPCFAKELNVIISIGSVLRKNHQNIKEIINILDNLLLNYDGNTYLLSTIFTLAIFEGMSLQQILKNKNISNKQVCKYLSWKPFPE